MTPKTDMENLHMNSNAKDLDEDRKLAEELDRLLAEQPDYRKQLAYTPIEDERASGISYDWDDEQYSMPDEGQRYSKMPKGGAKEIEELGWMASQGGSEATRLKGYLKRRRPWLGNHFRLNKAGLLAPRFRPTIDPRKTPETLEQATFACDRQVIDLHWLHCTGARVPIQQPEFSTLLTGPDFNFEMAAAFARSNMKADWKATKWLTLPERFQWELASIQTAALRKRWSSIRRGEGRGTQGMPQIAGLFLGTKLASDQAKLDELVMRWAVEKMLPEGKATERAKLFAVALGRAQDQPPHVFQRQQLAAMRRIKNAQK